MIKFRCAMFLLMMSCCGSWGCDLTLGPRIATKYVIVRPGKPLQVLSQGIVVEGRILNQSDEQAGVVKQDISGWIVMPLDHFEALKKAAESQGK
jgi:hypothetical protein